jgi:hypothetical protein
MLDVERWPFLFDHSSWVPGFLVKFLWTNQQWETATVQV